MSIPCKLLKSDLAQVDKILKFKKKTSSWLKYGHRKFYSAGSQDKVNFETTEVKQFTIVLRYNTIFALLMPVAGFEPSILGL